MDLSPTHSFRLVVIVLLSASVYFTVSVERERRNWSKHDRSVVLNAGDEVELVKVIDGDELSVRRGDDAFIVRLLGIKCFDATMNDPLVAQYGTRCVQALTDLVDKKALTVQFDYAALDERGRTLAYLDAAGIDVGQQLVAFGHAVVYTAYGFSRESAYLAAEKQARAGRKGVWRSGKVIRRIDGLKADWAERRGRSHAR